MRRGRSLWETVFGFGASVATLLDVFGKAAWGFTAAASLRPGLESNWQR